MAEKYKYWDVFEVLPNGWKIDKTCGSPLNGYDFCTDGISPLKGGKRALVRTIKKGVPRIKFVDPIAKDNPTKKTENVDSFIFPAKSVNILARKKFLEHLLREIQFDLMVCEIEGWDKKEYIKEIKSLINDINLSNKKRTPDKKQLQFFTA
jgi:hypothetical protein